MSTMESYYKAKGMEIVDETDKQIAVILPTNCTKREAKMMASFAAQQMNYEMRRRSLLKRGNQHAQ